MARKKVVLVVVEGPSDDAALGVIIERLYDKNAVHVEITHGDITADYNIEPEDIVKTIGNIVKSYADSMHFKQKDFQEVIHLIDMDGAYIPDSCVVEDKAADKLIYSLTSIHTVRPEKVRKRNKHKQEKLKRIIQLKRVWTSIPYRAFYMSSNLDHALYGKLNSTDEEKENDAYEFAKKYKSDINGFLKFISESDFSVRGDYKKTWNYIKEGVHSLERHTNFANCFNIVLQQLKHSEKKIVIFGAGIAGKYVLDICHKQGIQAACFCDNKLPEESYANGLTVHRLQRLAESGEDYCFIISIMDIEFIRNELEAFGFHDWVSIYNLYMPKKRSQKESFWDYHRLESVWYAHKNYECRDQLNLNSLDVVITERCSLKCRECSNLMQYYQAPQNFPLDDLKKEIERVLSVCDEIYEIRVIGGV